MESTIGLSTLFFVGHLLKLRYHISVLEEDYSLLYNVISRWLRHLSNPGLCQCSQLWPFQEKDGHISQIDALFTVNWKKKG